MRSLLHTLGVILIIALAYWAYKENYATQEALRRVDRLQQKIGKTREELGVLRAEWAYLNRPDRLRDLAELNFERLGLLPLQPDQFGMVDQVAYPQPDLLPITDPIEVQGRLGAPAEEQP